MTQAIDTRSIAERLADLPPDARTEVLSALHPCDIEALEHEWRFWARPDQLPPPGPWLCWLVLAGRGFGKTRMGAEWVRAKAREDDARIAIAGATYAQTRAVMVEGPSGVIAISPASERPRFEPSRQLLLWPNGATGHLFSAEQPEALRGPQHSAAWVDELAKCSHAQAFWDMMWMGLRLGDTPQAMVTTTPRPLPFLKALMAREGTVVTRGSTWANTSNLAGAFVAEMENRYAGTRLGAQELEGTLLEDREGALWTHALIDEARLDQAPQSLTRIVVAVDPAVTSHARSDTCGIIVAGCDSAGHGYVLADVSLSAASPDRWACAALNAVDRFGADRLVAEVNQGGDLVETMLRAKDSHLPYRGVHASRGKWVRAEPVAALYEQGRIHHVGRFADLEDEMTAFVPGSNKSPDRMDALVWALTDLLLGARKTPGVRSLNRWPPKQ
ncbi:MAG: terminase family protein [Pseudomonadota bacterium]